MADDDTSWWGRNVDPLLTSAGGYVRDAGSWFTPTSTPAGALYDAQTLGNARTAMVGDMGARLMAIGQGGMSFADRARMTSELGQPMATYNSTLQQGTGQAIARAQLRAADAAMIKAQAEAGREAGWQRDLVQYSNGGSGAPAGSAGPAPGTTLGSGPMAATPVSMPAPSPMGGGAPSAPSGPPAPAGRWDAGIPQAASTVTPAPATPGPNGGTPEAIRRMTDAAAKARDAVINSTTLTEDQRNAALVDLGTYVQRYGPVARAGGDFPPPPLPAGLVPGTGVLRGDAARAATSGAPVGGPALAPAGAAPAAPAAPQGRYSGPIAILNRLPPELAEGEFARIRGMSREDAIKRLDQLQQQYAPAQVTNLSAAEVARRFPGQAPGTLATVDASGRPTFHAPPNPNTVSVPGGGTAVLIPDPSAPGGQRAVTLIPGRDENPQTISTPGGGQAVIERDGRGGYRAVPLVPGREEAPRTSTFKPETGGEIVIDDRTGQPIRGISPQGRVMTPEELAPYRSGPAAPGGGAPAGPAAPRRLTDAEFRRGGEVAQQFRPRHEGFVTIQNQYLSGMQSVGRETAQDDVNAVLSLYKMRDPTSVVSANEIGNLSRNGAFDFIRNGREIVEALASGQKLNDEQRGNIAELLRAEYRIAGGNYARERGDYERYAGEANAPVTISDARNSDRVRTIETDVDRRWSSRLDGAKLAEMPAETFERVQPGSLRNDTLRDLYRSRKAAASITASGVEQMSITDLDRARTSVRWMSPEVATAFRARVAQVTGGAR